MISTGASNPKPTSWFLHGKWNVFEHGISRVMDAAATLAVLWCVSTETFSLLALAQAYVAPMLIFFVSPETLLYRDFGKWNAEGGGQLLTRIRVLRRFAWAKALLAVFLAAVFALVFPSPAGSQFGYLDKFFALIWSFFLSLLPQITGADREYLRLSLSLKNLSFLTFFQRTVYLASLIPVAIFFPTHIPFIALCSVCTAVVTAFVARKTVERGFSGTIAKPILEGTGLRFIRASLVDFSLWTHLSGVVTGYMQTMDLFFLGVFRAPAQVIGLYSVVLKLVGFTLVVPYALSNLFNVYLGRSVNSDRATEKRGLIRASQGLFILASAQALVFFWVAPFILELFSRGRWTELDRSHMVEWLRVILPSTILFALSLFWSGWLGVRSSYRKLFFAVYLPWLLVGGAVYGISVYLGGAALAAQSNLVVMALLIILLGIEVRRSKLLIVS